MTYTCKFHSIQNKNKGMAKNLTRREKNFEVRFNMQKLNTMP